MIVLPSLRSWLSRRRRARSLAAGQRRQQAQLRRYSGPGERWPR